MTLRTRLLAALLALLAAICIVVGVVSVLELNSFLTDRLDGQLATAGQRLVAGPDDARDMQLAESLTAWWARRRAEAT